MAASQTRLAAALEWAARGVAVLPIRPGGKAPLTRNGLHDASTDPAELRRWWARWPRANIAIATGHPGVDVLDVDVRGTESGWPAVRRLTEAGLLPEPSALALTPSGGVHLYFRGTQQRNGSLHAEHLDFRSLGGYVLVPPSAVTTDTYSGIYRWERRIMPTATVDWQAVTGLLRSPPVAPTGTGVQRSGRWGVNMLAAAVERAPVGNRNNMLFWALCEAVRSRYADLRPIADAGVRAGLTVREVEATWRQAVKRVATDGQADASPPSAGTCQTRRVRSRSTSPPEPAVER